MIDRNRTDRLLFPHNPVWRQSLQHAPMCVILVAMLEKTEHPVGPLLVYASWIALTALTPYLKHVYNFRAINPNLLPGIRMTLLLLVTVLYARAFERRRFSDAFNLSFKQVGRNVLWAVVFFLVATAVVQGYEYVIVRPALGASVEASGGASEAARSVVHRLIEYAYVLYEGIVEVLIFIGFLLDRLAKRWGWGWSLIVTNVGFALWHFSYLRQGWLPGGLMILLTFFAGLVISMSYIKTKNSLSPMICHTLVDLPSEISMLLGV